MGHSNPNCYARSLADCSVEDSREHWMPGCMLRVVNQDTSAVLTRNHTFQNGEELQPIGLKSLSSWILCKKHNNQLNDNGFDSAGCLTLDALDQMIASAGEQTSTPHTYGVKGDDLERCMLKILCGGLYSGAYPLMGGGQKGVPLPDNLLSILYRNQPFPDGHGLWVVYGPAGETFETRPEMIRAMVIQADDDTVIGLRIWLLDVEFNLVLADVPSPCPALEHALYRPSGITIEGINKRLEFTWGEHRERKEVRFRWLGRAN